MEREEMGRNRKGMEIEIERRRGKEKKRERDLLLYNLSGRNQIVKHFLCR
jgi:hypothetical protein